jgi:hypothetical protein
MAIQISVQGVDDQRPRELWNQLKEYVFAPDSRSQQVKIGPSGIGDACDKCVAETMALMLPDVQHIPTPGGLKAFFGTGLHLLMEERVQEFAMSQKTGLKILAESKFDVGEIPGYGMIRGTTDCLYETTVFDWKTSDRPKIAKYRLKGVPKNYSYQAQMYGLGASLAGHKVEWCSLVFFPRDSNDVRDIWQYVEPFNPALAHRALARATRIWDEFVTQGRIDELDSDLDCWRCKGFGVPVSITLERD